MENHSIRLLNVQKVAQKGSKGIEFARAYIP
jgi:hypothetical protein